MNGPAFVGMMARMGTHERHAPDLEAARIGRRVESIP